MRMKRSGHLLRIGEMKSEHIEQLSIAVTLWTRIWEALFSNPGWDIGYVD
jgi:hypothetical protein